MKSKLSSTLVVDSFLDNKTKTELHQVRADIVFLNEKLAELYATLRMIFQDHLEEGQIKLQIVSTDRFNRVTEKTGFDHLIHEIEDRIHQLEQEEAELKEQLQHHAA